MSSRRIAKIAQAIKEVVSMCVLFELKDPRIRNVTIISAEVSSDMRNAKIYVSVLGDERTQRLCLSGLQSARGFLQAKIADRLQTRYTPILSFFLDTSVKQSIETSRLLEQIRAETSDEGDEGEMTDEADSGTIQNEVGLSGDEGV